MDKINQIKQKMIEYYSGDPKRIQHFLKVYEFAMIIAEGEQYDYETRCILEVTSLVHDIGIKVAKQKYNSSSGKYQEILGPAEAEKLLAEFDFDYEFIKRVCWLIAHHHTYDNISGNDYKALVEADFLVNLYEDFVDNDKMKSSAKSAYINVFQTKTGRELCKKQFGIQ